MEQLPPSNFTKEPGSKRITTTKSAIGTIIVVSVLVGGVSGGVFGGLAANGGIAGILNKNKNATTSSVDISQVTANVAPTITTEEDQAVVDLVKNVSPAVVSIIAKQSYSQVYGNSGSLFDQFFFGTGTQQNSSGTQEIGGGSGFIVTNDGMIITNKHVVTIEGADQYTVVMNDGKTYDAKVVATDPSSDIAVIKIEAKDLPTVTLGDSGSVQIGDTVVAIGNALGEYRNTVTKGIVSGLARTITAGDSAGSSETLHNVIQTDAAINYGNSGGPLLNVSGQVIGINTAISSSGQLIGFALPINVAKQDLTDVQKNGKIERPYLGVRYVPVNTEVQQEEKLSVDYGALLAAGSGANQPAIVAGGPADKAGLKEGDIILEIDGTKVTEQNDLSQILQMKSVGQTVTLKVLSGKDTKDVTATLGSTSS